MNTVTEQFLERIATVAPEVEESISRLNTDWLPEVPPTIVLFSEIGTTIAGAFERMPEAVRMTLFTEIEKGICNDNFELKTAVATGLIEAMIGRSDSQPNLFGKLEKVLGPMSLSHAVAWRNFGGV